jgi:hypothetical protein
MNDDVRRVIYGTIIGFFLVVFSWLSIIYISACGFTLTCYRASPLVIRTPIPTLIPVSHSVAPTSAPARGEFNACQVAAADLIGAWVTAGSPETGAFPFTDVNGQPCAGTFPNDVNRLLVDNSVWHTGQIGCVSCHNAEKTDRNGGLDLTTYKGILAGANGKDILGGGKWESSALHDVLVVQGLVPEGHSPDAPPVPPVIIYAGQHAADASVTATATP